MFDPRDLALQQARTVIATQDAELARVHSESEHPLSKREFDSIVAERDSLQAQVNRLIVRDIIIVRTLINIIFV